MSDAMRQYFTNRYNELKQYKAMLDRERTARILTIRADKGWGKQWLLNHMQMESERRQWPVAMLYLEGLQGLDTIRLLDEISRQMGGEILARNKQAKEDYSSRERRYAPSKGNGKAAGRVSIVAEQHSDLTIVGNVVAGDLVSFAPDPIERQFLENELSDAFFAGLRSYASPIMCGLILYGSNTKKQRNLPWLPAVLFPTIRREEITNLIVVMAGAVVPPFEGGEWRLTVETTTLGSFDDESICDYWLKRRNLPDKYLETVLMLARGQSPQQLAIYADTIEQQLKTGRSNH